MATQNMTLTAGQAKTEDYANASADQSDKILALILVNGGVVISKKTAALGGNSDEIAIVDDTKYTLKLSPAETAKLPASGVTVKVYQMVDEDDKTELFTGTVTVSAASEAVVYNAGDAPSFSFTQKFSANDALDVQIPAGAILTNIICENVTANTATINVGVSALGTSVVTAASITANMLAPLTIADPLFSKSSPQTLYVNSEAWGSCEVVLTFIWQKFV